MTEPRGKRRPRGRPRSESSKKAILEAAYRLLCREGLHSITVESLAREAGVSKATIYRWWPSKEAVVMEAYLNEVEARIGFPHTESALADLRVQLRKVVAASRGEDGRLFATFIACGQHCPEVLEAFQSGVLEPRRADVRRTLKRAVDQGELREDVDVELLMDAIYGPIVSRLLTEPKTLARDFADRLLDQLLAGIRGPAGDGTRPPARKKTRRAR